MHFESCTSKTLWISEVYRTYTKSDIPIRLFSVEEFLAIGYFLVNHWSSKKSQLPSLTHTCNLSGSFNILLHFQRGEPLHWRDEFITPHFCSGPHCSFSDALQCIWYDMFQCLISRFWIFIILTSIYLIRIPFLYCKFIISIKTTIQMWSN